MNNLVKHTTILWADDDPDELELIHAVLQDMGTPYHIVEMRNGMEALTFLEAAKERGTFPCLIVLDINMPVLNGKETLVRIKQDAVLTDIPVVLFTTSRSPIDKKFSESHGAEMLTKPITYDALKEIVNRLLHMCEVSVKAQ